MHLEAGQLYQTQDGMFLIIDFLTIYRVAYTQFLTIEEYLRFVLLGETHSDFECMSRIVLFEERYSTAKLVDHETLFN